MYATFTNEAPGVSFLEVWSCRTALCRSVQLRSGLSLSPHGTQSCNISGYQSLSDCNKYDLSLYHIYHDALGAHNKMDRPMTNSYVPSELLVQPVKLTCCKAD